MSKTKEPEDLRDVIWAYIQLPEKNLNLNWLSKKSGVSYTQLKETFKEKNRELSQEVLNKVNTAMSTSFNFKQLK